MVGNVRVRVVYDVVGDVPEVRVCANEVEAVAKPAVYGFAGRVGTVDSVVSDVEATHSRKKAERYPPKGS